MSESSSWTRLLKKRTSRLRKPSSNSSASAAGDDASDVGCEKHLRMRIQEYEKVRSQDDRLAVYPGHEQDALEWVVARNERFVVVDKRPMAESVVEDDPRDAPSR